MSSKKFFLAYFIIFFTFLAVLNKVIAEPPDEPPGLQKAIEVKNRFEDSILLTPGVVGIGIGPTNNGKPIIVVFTTTEGVSGIPRALEGIPVKIKVTGEFYAYPGPPNCDKDEDTYLKDNKFCCSRNCDCNDNDSTINPGAVEICDDGIDNNCIDGIDEGCDGLSDPEPTPTPTNPDCRDLNDPKEYCDSPIPLGVSTGHHSITAGTIGARLADSGGNTYALSNNHVYAAIYSAQIGDIVLQPGSYDGGTDPDDAFGMLREFVPILFCDPYPDNCPNNTVDAAIASTNELDNSTLSGYTPRCVTKQPAWKMPVKKYGRTTALTTGNINYTNVSVYVNYGNGNIAKFINQIAITKGSFSAGGDSGSLIVYRGGSDDNMPVALLFAGSNSDTIANPIDAVLNSFQVNVSIDCSQLTTFFPLQHMTFPYKTVIVYVRERLIRLFGKGVNNNHKESYHSSGFQLEPALTKGEQYMRNTHSFMLPHLFPTGKIYDFIQ